jgi:Polyketide cyclase / dehydrase and lipid transport
MRYHDQPTVEVTQRIRCDVAAAWRCVTDIELPTRRSAELREVRWLGDASGVVVGARFRGRNQRGPDSAWDSECEVAEVEEQRRWVWNVLRPEGVCATWAFEVEPIGDGLVLARQWVRMGPARSGFSAAIALHPEREAEIVSRRLEDWRRDMTQNLELVRDQCEDVTVAASSAIRSTDDVIGQGPEPID